MDLPFDMNLDLKQNPIALIYGKNEKNRRKSKKLIV